MSTLRILVPVKRVIDYAVRPRVNAAKTAVETMGVKMSMNPFDEISVEESIRVRERHGKGRVVDIVAVSAGKEKAKDVLRSALAMGVDRGILVDVGGGGGSGGVKGGNDGGNGELEPLAIAKILKELVKRENCNLVIMGKQAIDDDCGQTGQILAGLLGWGQATQAAEVRIGSGNSNNGGNTSNTNNTSDGRKDDDCDDRIRVVREVDGGTETVEGMLPMVITTDLRLNEPRYASLPNIMKAKKKPLVTMSIKEFGIDLGRKVDTVGVEEPPPRKGGYKVENVDELIGKLKELGTL